MTIDLTKIAIAVARLENNRAAAPHSRAGIPSATVRGWNLESAPVTRRCEAVGAPGGSAASKARMARLSTLALGSGAVATQPASPARMVEVEKRIPMSFSPPRFKTLKKGERAGQTVEVKWVLRLYTRTVTNGAATFTATARLSAAGLVPPQSAGGKSFATVHQDFRKRWPDQADALIRFLAFRDEV